MKINWLDRTSVRLPYLTLCLSEDEYLSVAKHIGSKYPEPWLGDDSAARCHTWVKDSKIICAVCIRPVVKDDPRDSINIVCSLVHESVHVFQELCESIGEESPSAEFEAYSIQRISEELLREYARRLL